MPEDLNIKESTMQDIEPDLLQDLVPESLIRIYIYEMINNDNPFPTVQDLTVSVTTISQKNLGLNKELHNLERDMQGNYYANMLAAVTANEVLDISSATSAFGNKLKQENSYHAVSNNFYEHKKFNNMVVSVGEPFDKDKYEAGEQPMYIITEIETALGADFDNNLDFLPPTETLTGFRLINITNLEKQATLARILFTTNEKLSEDVLAYDGSKGISLGIEAHTLLHSIKGKGITQELDKTGNVIGEEFGEVDLISKEQWAPIKGTPTSTTEKTSLFFDWFDYDNVLPFVHIHKFKAGGSLSDVITNTSDREMIEDMLTLSAGFSSSWDTAPVITSGSETGKIKPDYRVGHKGYKASLIAVGNPINIIDGIYEKHLLDEPEFETTIDRYQPTRAIINALSRYLYTSYAIGKGKNSYNQAYLPWYLEPYFNTPVKFTKAKQIANPDVGATGQVTTYILNDGVKFQAKSIFFHANYSADIIGKGNADLELPTNINFSNQKLMQTDRKLILPELPAVIKPITKLPLPGDINTASSEALKYILYAPIQSQTLFEEFMLNKLTAHTGPAVGTDIDVQLPRTPGGTTWTQAQANAAILAKYPGGKIKTATILAQEEEVYRTHAYSWEANRNGTRVFRDGHLFSEYEKGKTIEEIIAKDIGVLASGVIVSVASTTPGIAGSSGTYEVKLKYTRFSLAAVTIITQAGTSFSYAARQVIFDKQEWKDFLVKFAFVPDKPIPYTFDERPNWKIKKLDELVISSVWANEIKIYFGSAPNAFITIPMLNKDDETIATQRILFN